MTAPLGSSGAAGAGSAGISPDKDTNRLYRLGFSPADVSSKVKAFLSAPSEAVLSLSHDRVITFRERTVSTNFVDRDKDISFLLKKALELSETPEEKYKLFFRALQVCQELAVDEQEILTFNPFITLKVQEASLGAGSSLQEECTIPSSLLKNASVLQNMLSGFSFEVTKPLILPEGYSIDHFKIYVEMSTQPDYDFLAADPSLLLDLVPLASYFNDMHFISRVDNALKAHKGLELTHLAHLFEKVDTYPHVEKHLSSIINNLIKKAINNNTPLDELLGQLHSLDSHKWLQSHALELDLAIPKVTDATLESLKSLKIARLNLANSVVTKLPEEWLDTLHFLDISHSSIAVLQRLPHLTHLVACGDGSLPSDVTALTDNRHLEILEISAPLTTFPTGLTGLKKLIATNCPRLTNCDALNGCLLLEELELKELPSLVSISAELPLLKKFKADDCPLLTHLDVLTRCAYLEELELLDLIALEKVPSRLRRLKRCEISYCSSLADLAPLTEYKELQELRIWGLSRLTTIPPGLENLRIFEAFSCPNLAHLYHLSCSLLLEEMKLWELPIEEVPTGFAKLRHFEAHFCSNLKDLRSLNTLLLLEELHLVGLTKLTDLPEGLLGLQKIYIAFCPLLKNLSPFNALPLLENITLIGLKTLEKLAKELPGIKNLRIEDCPNFKPS